MVEPTEPRKSSFTTVSVPFFNTEMEILKKVMARGDALGFRLDRSKALRLLIRAADVDSIPREAFEGILLEGNERRKKKGKNQSA